MTCCSVRLRRHARAADLPHDSAYGASHADVYDDLYDGRGKDYAAESRAVATLIRTRNRKAASLLDVGCGSGRHLQHLAAYFTDVEGTEPSAAMRTLANARLRHTPIHDQGLPGLRLGRRYDAVICMFSVIGYVGGETGSIPALRASVDAMAAHLNPGGVLIVEPWLFPERYRVGHIGSDFTRTRTGRVIFRMSHSGLTGAGRVSVLTMNYLVGDADGVTHFEDIHLMTMYTATELADSYASAGLSYDFVESGFSRGVAIGVRGPVS
jgi:SAM-dependent methyltransferase